MKEKESKIAQSRLLSADKNGLTGDRGFLPMLVVPESSRPLHMGPPDKNRIRYSYKDIISRLLAFKYTVPTATKAGNAFILHFLLEQSISLVHTFRVYCAKMHGMFSRDDTRERERQTIFTHHCRVISHYCGIARNSFNTAFSCCWGNMLQIILSRFDNSHHGWQRENCPARPCHQFPR